MPVAKLKSKCRQHRWKFLYWLNWDGTRFGELGRAQRFRVRCLNCGCKQDLLNIEQCPKCFSSMEQKEKNDSGGALCINYECPSCHYCTQAVHTHSM